MKLGVIYLNLKLTIPAPALFSLLLEYYTYKSSDNLLVIHINTLGEMVWIQNKCSHKCSYLILIIS